MAEAIHDGDFGYAELLAVWNANNQAAVIYDHTGIAWVVIKAQDVPFFTSVDRDDPAWIVPRTDGRWHKLYGYTPIEEQL